MNPITGLAVTGGANLTKCACTDCVDPTPGSGCSSLFWQPANLAQSCAKPRIAPEGDEALYDVYSTICRSVKSGISDTSGNMGWVHPNLGAPQQCALHNQLGAQKVGPVSDLSVWCAAESSSSCPSNVVDEKDCVTFTGCTCTITLGGPLQGRVGVCSGRSSGIPTCLPCGAGLGGPCPDPFVCNEIDPTGGECV